MLRALVQRYAQRHSLSSQERNVLLLAVIGAHDGEIADSLACSRNTVATYWRRIFEKTDARGQKSVIAHLLRWSLSLAPAREQPVSEVVPRLEQS